MPNLYRQFRQLIPEPPLQAGVVLEANAAGVVIALPGGGLLRARGEAQVGHTVFVRDGVIEGSAPALPLEVIEI